MVELLKVWLSDDNAMVREKLRRGVATRLTPLLAVIVAPGQGRRCLHRQLARSGRGVCSCR